MNDAVRLQLEDFSQDVSSSEVRRRLEAGRSVDGIVPAAVAAYIRGKNLYVSV